MAVAAFTWFALFSQGLARSNVPHMAPSLLQADAKLASAQTALLQAEQLMTARDTKAALGGFQKFTDEMVAKYAHGYVDDTTKTAIQTVINYMDTLYEMLLNWHNIDKGLTDKCNNRFNSCGNKHLDDDTVGFINELGNDVDTLRSDHETCRNDCKSNCSKKTEACAKYDEHRIDTSKAIPICAGSTAWRTGIPAEEGSDELVKVERCLEDMHGWLPELALVYHNCSRLKDSCTKCHDDCDEYQSKFEVEYCQHATLRHDHCHATDVCQDLAKDQCEADCDQLAKNVEARVAQNETGERIECLLNVLLTDNESKAGDLATCKSKNYTFPMWQLSCDSSTFPPSYTSRVNCNTTLVPCTTAWTNEEYSEIDPALQCKEQCESIEVPYHRVHNGVCKGSATMKVRKEDIGACAVECDGESSCHYFSWAPALEDGENCFVFSTCEPVPANQEDDKYFTSYSLNVDHDDCPWLRPHALKFDKILCSDGSFVNWDASCGENLDAIQCPSNRPYMCADFTCQKGEDGDAACGDSGKRACGED